MGFPCACYCVEVPKPLLLLTLLLEKVKPMFSTALLHLGLHSLAEVPPLPPSDGSPLSDDDHAYRLSAADLPSPLQAAASSATPASIKRRLRVVPFAELAACRCPGTAPDDDGQEPVTCAVCLRVLEAAQQVREPGNCRHAFHRGCLDRWVDQGRGTCPLCRSRLLPQALWAVSTVHPLHKELLGA